MSKRLQISQGPDKFLPCAYVNLPCPHCSQLVKLAIQVPSFKIAAFVGRDDRKGALNMEPVKKTPFSARTVI